MDREAIQERYGIVGNSVAMRQLLERVRMVSNSDITVLIEGESGVGKELIAQALHGMSHRKHKSMVTVNCGAIPEGLIESELFGHERGSYTGATDQRKGHFEEADGGTIFLDEIGEMPLPAQVRLLRVLESGTFSRVGSSKTIKVNVRVIAATNKDLAQEVRNGQFREDLYYRLSTIRLDVPPLRERKEDIMPLFEHFLYRFARQYNAPMKRPDETVRQLLDRYPFPGNIRELRNLAEQSTVLVRGNALTATDLQPLLRGVTAGGALTHLGGASEASSMNTDMIYRALFGLQMEMRDLKGIIHALAAKEGVASYVNPYAKSSNREYVYYDDSAAPTSPPLLPPSSLPSNTSVAPVFPSSFQPNPFESNRFESPLDKKEAPLQSEFHAISSSKDYHTEFEDAISYDIEHTKPLTPESEADLDFSKKKLPTLQEVEVALIVEGLKRYRGNRRKTAKALGISERTLYRKINELDLHELANEEDF